MMYEGLVKRLRETTFNHEEKCESCSYDEDYPCCADCLDEMHKEAADAIEELVRKEKFHTFLWNVINPNEMEQYIEMYNSKGIPVCGFPEPPKGET